MSALHEGGFTRRKANSILGGSCADRARRARAPFPTPTSSSFLLISHLFFPREGGRGSTVGTVGTVEGKSTSKTAQNAVFTTQSCECDVKTTQQEQLLSKGSIPSDKRELPCYIVPVPRTDLSEDRESNSIFDRGKGNGSRTFSNALRDQKDPRSIKISFSNSRAPSTTAQRMAHPISHLSCRPSLPRHTVGLGA